MSGGQAYGGGMSGSEMYQQPVWGNRTGGMGGPTMYAGGSPGWATGGGAIGNGPPEYAYGGGKLGQPGGGYSAGGNVPYRTGAIPSTGPRMAMDDWNPMMDPEYAQKHQAMLNSPEYQAKQAKLQQAGLGNPWGGIQKGGERVVPITPVGPMKPPAGGLLSQPGTGYRPGGPQSPTPSEWNNANLSPEDMSFIRMVTNSDPGRQNNILSTLMSKDQINSSMYNNPLMDPGRMHAYLSNPANARMLQMMGNQGFNMNDWLSGYGVR